MRFFSTAGPVQASKHYCVPPLERVNLDELLPLIEQEKYFVLHAPRQTGKTSSLLALMEHLNRGGRHRCVYVNVEVGQAAREDVARAMRPILDSLADAALRQSGDRTVADAWPGLLDRAGPDGALRAVLAHWAETSSLPVVLLIDEVDALVGDTLVSLLRQIRAGYPQRPHGFPQSVVLCGVRDVRDYRIHVAADRAPILGGSAFNVKAESLRLGDFTRDEVERLLGQHTDETGQRFAPAALETVWRLTEGQPWLVNALAYEVCCKLPEGQDRARAISEHLVRRAKENLILRRETHLDQLADKLREERIRRVLEPILIGGGETKAIPRDDIDYAVDLGLVKVAEGTIRVANPIYQEVIPRELAYDTQLYLPFQSPPYVRPDGSLDVKQLLGDFQAFFRKESELWRQRFQYQEAWPHLLLQAFLAKVVNGGGTLAREYAVGSGRVDLFLEWPGRTPRKPQRALVELKLIRSHDAPAKVIAQGIAQTAAYAQRFPEAEAHLLVIDRRPRQPWSKKCFRRTRRSGGRAVTVWGL